MEPNTNPVRGGYVVRRPVACAGAYRAVAVVGDGCEDRVQGCRGRAPKLVELGLVCVAQTDMRSREVQGAAKGRRGAGPARTGVGEAIAEAALFVDKDLARTQADRRVLGGRIVLARKQDRQDLFQDETEAAGRRFSDEERRRTRSDPDPCLGVRGIESVKKTHLMAAMCTRSAVATGIISADMVRVRLRKNASAIAVSRRSTAWRAPNGPDMASVSKRARWVRTNGCAVSRGVCVLTGVHGCAKI